MSRPAPGRLGPTTPTQLIAAGLAGALLGQVILTVLGLAGVFAPVVPWSVPAVVAVMGVAALIYARGLRRRVLARAVPAVEAVRALIVAKSAAMTGGVLFGMHLVYVVNWLPKLEAEIPARRVLLGAVTMLASGLLVWGGRSLERACIDPDSPDDDDTSASDGQ